MGDLDFLFVCPTALHGFGFHLGASYVRAYLEARGVRTGQFIHPGNATYGEIAEQILEHHPRIVGFTCYDLTYPRVRLLSERIRRARRETVIVCGGPSATWSGETILADCPAIDVCVRHEGEATAHALHEWATGGRALEAVPGITYRAGREVRRTPHPTPEGEWSASLDQLPDPYLGGVLPPGEAARVGLVSSRGCPFACTFCNGRLMSRGGVRFHSVNRVVSVLSFLDRELAGQEGRPTSIRFHDDTLLAGRDRLHSLLRRIAELAPKNLCFSAMLRPDLLTSETVRLLKDARFTDLHFGLESAVPRVLAAVERVRVRGAAADGYRREEAYLRHARRAVREARRAGLSTSVSVILGCPAESEADGQATLDFVRQLGVDRYFHLFLGVNAGTELERTCGSFGIQVERTGLAPLPRRTRLAYAAHRLRMLDTSSLFPARTDDRMSLAMRLLTGELETRAGAASSRQGLGAYGPVLGVSKRADPEVICRWVANELPYGSVICLLSPGREAQNSRGPTLEGRAVPNRGPKDGHERERFDGAPFEVLSLRAASRADGGTSWRLDEQHVEAPAESTLSIRVLPLADVDWTGSEELADPLREALLLSTDTARDADALVELVAAGREAGHWRIPPGVLSSCAALADGCRWAGRPCPAAEGLRWLVYEDGTISSCSSGAPLGRLGARAADLAEAAEGAHLAAAERRNCAACPVVATCSRCPFPGSLGREAFCAVRRLQPDLPVFVDGLTLARFLLQADLVPAGAGGLTIRALRGTLRGELTTGGSQLPLSECSLLSFEGTASGFLFHARGRSVVPLGGDSLRAVEALVDTR